MKIICVGRNYTDHIKELENNKPKDPVLFLKPDSSIILNNKPFFIPDFSQNIHYELELIIKISRLGKHIQEKFSHKYYDFIGLGIDFTARDLQTNLKSKGLPWEKSKAFDGSCFISKWINKSDFNDINNLNFNLDKNGKTVQKTNSKLMLWKIDELISYISTFFTLKIGDVIFTGTPAGVGKVSIGDNLEGFIEDNKIFNLNIK
ncbi:MAG: 2-hydroxyhepta-2,4-diene-1,7-dioate isomerase [Flavobacteriaceae bacterium]|nr:2-hydroxyhepta-2,4-diene-1,7-dioate isomerase [Flavobacteriaceae bacterium]RPG95703.1 MAG: FAA hydrolase family protein [Candidatus Pelagibacter sp. TMED253]|tara:strand:+ start:1152 stop:1763 length:612 start_codon:yes stop_codon:yes gene_type:complete